MAAESIFDIFNEREFLAYVAGTAQEVLEEANEGSTEDALDRLSDLHDVVLTRIRSLRREVEH
ncbi:MAG: hypothetical protein F4Z31_07690 [Gemmatimonadetes bacterium]|nr:hypothetical protein [Gemmatimonadota bacterium]MYJ10056.1 hypothetical protein [Gemmatimonadota bacterium]